MFMERISFRDNDIITLRAACGRGRRAIAQSRKKPTLDPALKGVRKTATNGRRTTRRSLASIYVALGAL